MTAIPLPYLPPVSPPTIAWDAVLVIANVILAGVVAVKALEMSTKDKSDSKADSTTEECPEEKSKKSKRRDDSEAPSKDKAIEEAKNKAGDKGQSDWTEIKDPKTGEVIGRRSPDGKQEWRVDPPHTDLPASEPASQRPHVNWKNWQGGKQNGGYGHVFF